MTAGRPRSFDTDTALEAAMLVFWRHGYPATSLTDLKEAMAINKPSMYAAFGNKEQLFMNALEHYIGRFMIPTVDLLFDPALPFELRLRNFLKTIARIYARPDLPKGCMMANSVSESAGDGLPANAHDLVDSLYKMTEQRMTDFFAQELTDGTLFSDSTPSVLARYLMTVTSGMSVMSRNGATLAELDDVIEHVVATFR
jgi:AcrR family transcriptional regulator